MLQVQGTFIMAWANGYPELLGMRRFISPHRGSASGEDDGDMSYLMMHPVYTTEYAESVKPKHKIPEKVRNPQMHSKIPALTKTQPVPQGSAAHNCCSSRLHSQYKVLRVERAGTG